MSYERLMEMTESPAEALLNWREVVEEINIELTTNLKNNESIERREALFQMLKSLMDMVEKTIAPQDLEKFREARGQQYHSFLIQEALVGVNVCAETLLAVTSREIAAGRMTEENSIRKIAVDGYAAPHLTRAQLEEEAKGSKAEKEKGFMGRVKSFFGR